MVLDSNHMLTSFGGCLGHGLECPGFVPCWIGNVVASVMSTSGSWCHSVSICCAVVLPDMYSFAGVDVRHLRLHLSVENINR
jgi:hypothetical protein